jgi:hypothetical protein
MNKYKGVTVTLSGKDVSFVDMTAWEVKKDSRRGELGFVY